MIRETVLARSIRVMFVGGLVLGMQAAQAQAPASAEVPAEPEKITVTGSRIRVATVTEGASPITVVGAADIKSDGVKNTESLLNNLPQVFADQGGSVSNGSTGTATVNLRNLGADRTLVLVNGRRLPQGSPLSTAADLNQVPAGLIKRVEVLTGGAGAVYGSDAVAGVVNFILNDRFEGFQFDANLSGFNHQQGNNAAQNAVRARNYQLPGNKNYDGQSRDMSVLMGGNFSSGRGNATLYMGYKEDKALLQSERDFTACALSSDAAGFKCAGSGTSYPGLFYNGNFDPFTVADANGGVRAFNDNTDLYNYGPLNYLQRPSKRYTFNATANYEISDQARVYASLGAHNDHTVAQIAPSGLFGINLKDANAVRFENPLLSQAWRDTLGLAAPGDTANALILRRNIEGGGRQADITNSSFRMQVGVKGELGPWNYDLFGQSARVSYNEVYRNEFSRARALKAMDVVVGTNGAPVCRSALNGTDPACVPYNIWSLGKVTPEALAYLTTPGLRSGYTTQKIIGGNIGADLGAYGLKLPGASSGVGFSFGLEQRSEKLQLETDSQFSSGDLFGQGGPSRGVSGTYTVKDAFGEVRVPILEKVPFAELLSLNASYRYSDFSTGKSTDSYGIGLEWAPTKTAKLRASYQRAARAPNIVELYTPSGLSLFNNDNDPCAGAAPIASASACANTGVTPAQYGNIPDNPAGQYNQIVGGVRTLNPETADSYTLGLVLTPSPALGITLDAFSINVEDVIASIPPTTTLNKCLETGNPAYCGLIKRDDAGSLWIQESANITALNANLATRKTTGLDVGVNYGLKLAANGSLGFSVLGTWLRSFDQVNVPGDTRYDCAGLYGPTCGTPLPTWRHKARMTWATPFGADLAFTWRYLHDVALDRTSANKELRGATFGVDRKLAAQNYLDVSGSFMLTRHVMLSGGINNLLDRDPPITAQAGSGLGNGNTYPQVYDAMGRKIFVGMSAKF